MGLDCVERTLIGGGVIFACGFAGDCESDPACDGTRIEFCAKGKRSIFDCADIGMTCGTSPGHAACQAGALDVADSLRVN